MAKAKQPVTQIQAIPPRESRRSLALQGLTVLIVEPRDHSEIVLKLKPSQEVQAFLVLPKPTLPTID
jgi:hypothetical protein